MKIFLLFNLQSLCNCILKHANYADNDNEKENEKENVYDNDPDNEIFLRKNHKISVENSSQKPHKPSKIKVFAMLKAVWKICL